MLTLSISIALAPADAIGASISAPSLERYNAFSWTEAEGLEGVRIRAIVQDRIGYIWLGTNAGLVRFDGVRFVTLDALHGRTLRSPSVRALHVGKDGTLWIGFGGVGSVTSLHDGRLIDYGVTDGLAGGVVNAFLEDHLGTLWVGQGGGLSRFRRKRWEQIGEESGLPTQAVTSLHEDRKGNLWVGTVSGIFLRAPGVERFLHFSNDRIQAFAEASDGMVWVTGVGIPLARLSQSGVSRVALPSLRDVSGSRLLWDRRGGLWLGTAGRGIARVNLSDSVRPQAEHLEPETLSNNVIRSVFEDHEGSIWVGTERGLNRLTEGVVTSLPRRGDPSLSGSPRAVLRSRDGSLWAGSTNGVYRRVPTGWQHYGQESGLKSEAVTALFEDDKGALWVATNDGISKFADGRFVPVPSLSSLTNVRAMAKDGLGNLWVADRNKGVFQLSKGSVTSTMVANTETKSPYIIVADRKGAVWIGFQDGTVVRYDHGRYRAYSQAEGLPGAAVLAIHEDRDGALWVGTTVGLSRLHNEHFVTVTQRNGLPGTIIQTIVEDQSGELWLGLNSGIARFSKKEFDKAVLDPFYKMATTLYDISDGLRGFPSSLTQPLAMMERDGTLWFVTTDGFAIVDPRFSEKQRLPPRIHIEGAVGDGKHFDVVPGTRLPAGTSTLQIDYTALSFAAPSKVRFRYRLEGIDQDWIEAGASQRSVTFSSLRPGHYRFRLMAAHDDNSSAIEAQWEFSIQPMFYQTRWFATLGASVIALIIGTAWQIRVRQIKARASLVLAERARLAREIHDTLLQSLVGVAMQCKELAEDVKSSSMAAHDRCESLRKQVEASIEDARRSILNLRSTALDTNGLAHALRRLGDDLTKDTGTRFEFSMAGLCPQNTYAVDDHLFKIGQEAIINAVRHSHAGRIRIEIDYSDQIVRLRIVDDGCGFDPDSRNEAQQGHWGLATMKERVSQMGGACRILTGPGLGTTIEIVVPFL